MALWLLSLTIPLVLAMAQQQVEHGPTNMSLRYQAPINTNVTLMLLACKALLR